MKVMCINDAYDLHHNDGRKHPVLEYGMTYRVTGESKTCCGEDTYILEGVCNNTTCSNCWKENDGYSIVRFIIIEDGDDDDGDIEEPIEMEEIYA